MLNGFSNDLAGEKLGVVDATPNHHKTLYFFLLTYRGYYSAPHVRLDPDADAVETLYRIHDRVAKQEPYLKRPQTIFE